MDKKNIFDIWTCLLGTEIVLDVWVDQGLVSHTVFELTQKISIILVLLKFMM